MASRFSGQVALVTGGSRGIGRGIALRLASEGARVFINYTSNKEKAESVAQECILAGGAADVMGFDISNSDMVTQQIELIKERAGRLDILINNAGISRDGLFIRMKDEDWFETINTNLSGAFFCSRAAAKIMMKARFGRIINIGSVVGEVGNAGQVPYCASKAGLMGLSKAMAKELASRGITVNVVTPGFIETDMTSALGEDVRAEHFKQIPLGRYGSADDIAGTVAFLASADASYITGQIIGVNGGMRM